MTHTVLANFFGRLDLTNPHDLHLAFHCFRSWPVIKPLEATEKGFREFQIIERYAKAIFAPGTDNALSPALISGFLRGLGKTATCVGPQGKNNPGAPREWMYIFRTAFDRGIIGPIGFGFACRYLLTWRGGNGAPQHPIDSAASNLAVLEGVRLCAPEGLMLPDELEQWRALPDNVTVYRGGQGNLGQSRLDHAQSLHWASTRVFADTFVMRRAQARDRHATLTQARRFKTFALTGRSLSGVFDKDMGKPFMLKATIPKEHVLALFSYGDIPLGTGEPVRVRELLVDFEKLTPDMIEDVTPAGYRRVA